MDSTELTQRLETFERAVLSLLENVAQLNAEGLPFTVSIDDCQGNNLLRAEVRALETGGECLFYLDEDQLASL
ncbi:MAG TPA: hypothetical protein VG206_25185 [Terriglobia bacterium]|nr:hypothetical protein [Terriglobia bacterium]